MPKMVPCLITAIALSPELLKSTFPAGKEPALRLLHIPAPKKPRKRKKSDASKEPPLGILSAIHSLVLNREDLPSWTVENDINNGSSLSPLKTLPLTAAAFLDPSSPTRGYCSFIVQDDPELLKNFLSIPSLPFSGELPLEDDVKDTMTQTDPVWVFVGRSDRAQAG